MHTLVRNGVRFVKAPLEGLVLRMFLSMHEHCSDERACHWESGIVTGVNSMRPVRARVRCHLRNEPSVILKACTRAVPSSRLRPVRPIHSLSLIHVHPRRKSHRAAGTARTYETRPLYPKADGSECVCHHAAARPPTSIPGRRGKRTFRNLEVEFSRAHVV